MITSIYTELTAQLSDLEELPAPAIIAAPGFIDTLDFDTQREMIAELAGGSIKCVKADRPGIKFDPFTRIQWDDE